MPNRSRQVRLCRQVRRHKKRREINFTSSKETWSPQGYLDASLSRTEDLPAWLHVLLVCEVFLELDGHDSWTVKAADSDTEAGGNSNGIHKAPAYVFG